MSSSLNPTPISTESAGIGAQVRSVHVHVEHAKSHAGSDTLVLGVTFYFSALTFANQNRPKEAKSEALRALAIFEGFGATNYIEETKELLKKIEERSRNEMTTVSG